MRKLLLASAALSALTLGAAQAQESPVKQPATERAEDQITTQSTNENAETGAAVGGTAGAITGAVVGGPVGAVIGGFAGAMLGTAASVPQPAVDYVVANPVEPVVIEGELREGMTIPASAALQPIPEHSDLAYVYVDGRPLIVKAETREVVYSPGYLVPDESVAYVKANPVDPMTGASLTLGASVPAEVQLVQIPNDPAYAYVYTDAGPVLVNTSSRTVVWVQGG
ncbi:DUF1236 domain-containing protein [Nitratireductor sp. CAU 1489]|uniref:DUF1236 domain-containing protein n=1 Tax=Nitratireductor arenosus TaxID=2682096 RepID=A0A844Q998_9HYPH|nr:DUF1236 domain-containing protein [Nitratireductor arenosus]MVA95682.1 DUF1236 domain-containing protein [Nitratireductor arenosus]